MEVKEKVIKNLRLIPQIKLSNISVDFNIKLFYNGIFPCFFNGLLLCLFCVISSAWITLNRV